MFRIIKYLKPFGAGLLLTVVLLFTQAICDLSLPNFMSRIVNVGIQQSGLERVAPEAVNQQSLELITALMSDGEKQLIYDHYALVSSADIAGDGRAYAELYPLAEPLFYLKKEGDAATEQAMDEAFGVASLALLMLLQDLATQNQNPAGTREKGFDPAQLRQLQSQLALVPRAAITTARDKALVSDQNTRRQSGVMLSKLFYTEMGLDLITSQRGYILRTGLLMLLIALAGGCAAILVGLFSARIATGAARNVRRDVFAKVESFSNREFDRFSTASLITRCTNDITQIQELFLHSIRIMFYAPIIGIGAIIMAINKSPSMSWIIVLALICLLGCIVILMIIAIPKFKAIQQLIDRLNLVTRENLSGLTVIRAFRAETHEKGRFDQVNRELTGTLIFISRLMVVMMPVMILIMNGVTLLVVWVGAHQIATSSLQIGDMMAFMQYAIQIVIAFLMISMMFVLLPRAAVSAQRVAEVLGTENSITDPDQPLTFPQEKKGLLEFKNVHFRYEGAEEDALHNVSFTAQPGQTTAIIGATGAGKTTIANLALRFYDVARGQILVNGVDIRRVRQEDLRAVFGYVPQKGILLSGAIAENLSYGNSAASEKELTEAAEVAQIMDFISESPQGFAGEIAQGGANISGGQKQRLSIARALVKKPEIIIFDDSFSALDYQTDAALRRALKKHTVGLTVVLITQRVGTIMQADKILVLNKGRLIGAGTHRELLHSCPEYYEIASSQLPKEELS